METPPQEQEVIIKAFGFSEDTCLEQLEAILLWQYGLPLGKVYYPLPSYPQDVYLVFEINNLFYPVSGTTAEVKGRELIRLELNLSRVIAVGKPDQKKPPVHPTNEMRRRHLS